MGNACCSDTEKSQGLDSSLRSNLKGQSKEGHQELSNATKVDFMNPLSQKVSSVHSKLPDLKKKYSTQLQTAIIKGPFKFDLGGATYQGEIINGEKSGFGTEVNKKI